MKTLDHRIYYSPVKIYRSYDVLDNNIIENTDEINFNTIHLKNCYFVHNCFKNNKYIISLSQESQKNDNYKNTILNCYNHKQKDNQIVIKDKLYLWHVNTDNYLHFIKDGILVLNEYIKNTTFNEFKILVMKSKLSSFSWDILKCLNLDKKIVFVNDILNNISLEKISLENVSFENLHIPIFNNKDSNEEYANYKIIKELKKMVENFNMSEHFIYDKIYVSRRTWIKSNNNTIGQDNTQTRKCLNEDTFVEILTKNGYKEIFLEDFSFLEKISILNKATKVITTYGAGCINFLFSKNINYYIFNSPSYHINKHLKSIIEKENEVLFFNYYKKCKVYQNCPWELDIEKVNKLFNYNNNCLKKNLFYNYNNILSKNENIYIKKYKYDDFINKKITNYENKVYSLTGDNKRYGFPEFIIKDKENINIAGDNEIFTIKNNELIKTDVKFKKNNKVTGRGSKKGRLCYANNKLIKFEKCGNTYYETIFYEIWLKRNSITIEYNNNSYILNIFSLKKLDNELYYIIDGETVLRYYKKDWIKTNYSKDEFDKNFKYFFEINTDIFEILKINKLCKNVNNYCDIIKTIPSHYLLSKVKLYETYRQNLSELYEKNDKNGFYALIIKFCTNYSNKNFNQIQIIEANNTYINKGFLSHCINFEKEPPNLSEHFHSISITDTMPSILYNTYLKKYIYYNRVNIAGGCRNISYSESRDLIKWSYEKEIILRPEFNYGINSDNIYMPSIFYVEDSNLYYGVFNIINLTTKIINWCVYVSNDGIIFDYITTYKENTLETKNIHDEKNHYIILPNSFYCDENTMSFFSWRHTHDKDDHDFLKHTLRKDGFTSLSSNSLGKCITKSCKFTNKIIINYKCDKDGYIEITPVFSKNSLYKVKTITLMGDETDYNISINDLLDENSITEYFSCQCSFEIIIKNAHIFSIDGLEFFKYNDHDKIKKFKTIRYYYSEHTSPLRKNKSNGWREKEICDIYSQMAIELIDCPIYDKNNCIVYQKIKLENNKIVNIELENTLDKEEVEIKKIIPKYFITKGISFTIRDVKLINK